MCFSKRYDLNVIEFMDFCQDGELEEAKRIFNEVADKRTLLQAKDPDLRTALHLVLQNP